MVIRWASCIVKAPTGHGFARAGRRSGKEPVIRGALVCIAVFMGVLLSGCQSTNSIGVPSEDAEAETPFALSDGQGALWFPATWTAALTDQTDPQLGDTPSQLRLRSLALVLRPLPSGAAIEVPLTDADSGSGRSAALTFDEPSRTFMISNRIALSPGQYAVSHVAATLIDEATERPQSLELPLPHPQPQNDQEPDEALVFKIQAGKVSALGRHAYATTFGLREGRLTTQNRAEFLEGERIAVSSVLRDLKWDPARQLQIARANESLPDIRYLIPTHVLGETSSGSHSDLPAKREGTGRIGFEVSVPCDFNGALKFVWKEDSSPSESVSAVELNGSGSRCDAGHSLKRVLLDMPVGNWLLTATEMASAPEVSFRSRIPQIQKPSERVREYYGAQTVADVLAAQTDGEQQLKRRFYLPLSKWEGAEGSFFYLGRFVITPNAGAAAAAENVAKAWNVLMQREFDLDAVLEGFASASAFNPYNGARLVDRRKTGRVDSLLQVSAEASKSAALEPYIARLRETLTKEFATCVQEKEKDNPLLVAGGELRFRFKKGYKTGAIEAWSIKGSFPERRDLENCFRAAFDRFRFVSSTPAAFQAEMSLDAK